MKLKLGFSPCPNDTFIFDALVNSKLDTHGLAFEVVLDDVEALNKMALEGTLQVTKLSYHAYAYVHENYWLLHSGSALGRGVGPLLVANEALEEETLLRGPVLIPGKMTTANFLLGLAYPALTNKVPTLFSEIEDKLVHGEALAGLIIHENRFTYQQKGLTKLRDLGQWWEQTTGLAIPLGGIAIRKDVPLPVARTVNNLIRKSIEIAYENTAAAMPYIREHAQAMEEAVMLQHIDLYVNEYSLDLGEEGRKAIQGMYQLAKDKGLFPAIDPEQVLLPLD